MYSIFDLQYATLVTDAIKAGCTSAEAIQAHMHTLPEFPYVDTDVVLEEAADLAADCNGVTFEDLKAKRQFGVEVFQQEMSEERCRECDTFTEDFRLGWKCPECGSRPHQDWD